TPAARPRDDARLGEHHHRLLQEVLQRLEEASAGRAVDHTVIAAHGHAHAWPDHDLAVLYDHLLLDPAHREDRRLRRIDDRGELIDAIHAEVGDGERRPRVLLGRELAFPGTAGQLPDLRRDLRHALTVRIPNHRRDEPVLHGHGHANVDPTVATDHALAPGGVDFRVPPQRLRR